MNGAVIQKVLARHTATKNIYKGFASVDTSLKKIKKYPVLFILNTDNSSGPGEHWCVAYFQNKHICEFFDSYGLSPDFYGFTKQLLKLAKQIKFNSFPVQGLQPTCGHHCLYYSIQRCRNNSSKFILSKLYKFNDTKFNDLLVYNFVKNNYCSAYAEFL
jgi:hypothetical protein